MDSTKLLTEKLTLARELSSLRPEVDHLRSQAASHQVILGEKLSLQRQVSTLQVELETEKRSMQRALAKEGRFQAEDAKLESRLESMQADLARTRREAERRDRDAQKASTESDNKIATLESRLDAFRNKLKSTKEQLKEVQSELQVAHASKDRSTANVKSSTSTSKNANKRTAVQIEADTMIGTPGDQPAAKRSRQRGALPGDKSTFSITPFFNRTTSVAPESPTSAVAAIQEETTVATDVASGNQDIPQAILPDQSETSTLARRGGGSSQRHAADGLNAPRPGKSNSAVMSRLKAVPRLEQVAEEGDCERADPVPVPAGSTIGRISREESVEGEQIRKKKRKVLGTGAGKTLFDDCELDAGDGGALGGTRSFGKLGLGGPRFCARKALGSAESFGTISPLKKDKRGVVNK